MAKKSKNPSPAGSTAGLQLTRGGRLPAFLRVPCPPEVARWQRGAAQHEPYRQISQERAAEITGRSRHTIRRWVSGAQPIDSSSLRLLQMWVWGIIPSAPFIEAGVFVARNQRWHPSYAGEPQELLATQNGYLVSAADLDSFGWLRGLYYEHWDAQQRAKEAAADEAPEPRRGAEIIPFADHLARRRRPRDTGTDQA